MSLLSRSQTRAMPSAYRGSFDRFIALFESSFEAQEIAQLRLKNPNLARQEVEAQAYRILQRNQEEFPRGIHHEYVRKILSSIFGFGPLDVLLHDSEITEIMVNGLESMYCEKRGVLEALPNPFKSESELLDLIDRMIAPLNRRLDESSPAVNARLPEGYRVHAIIAPLSLIGPVLTIRKFPEQNFELIDLCEKGSIDTSLVPFLKWAVLAKKNIAVTGGTGSGKTSLLNALSVEILPTERIITIEDSAELRFTEHPHVIRLEARPQNAEGKGCITIRDLVIHALRMRPDRIIVGECRGPEALDMLQAMNTGHDGSLTTLHANSPEEAISRLVTLVRYASELPVELIETQIASALQLIIHLTRLTSGQRVISRICEVHVGSGGVGCDLRLLYERDVYTQRACWHSAPLWLDSLAQAGIAQEGEVKVWLQSWVLA